MSVWEGLVAAHEAAISKDSERRLKLAQARRARDETEIAERKASEWRLEQAAAVEKRRVESQRLLAAETRRKALELGRRAELQEEEARRRRSSPSAQNS
jgi:hypothetical protein